MFSKLSSLRRASRSLLRQVSREAQNTWYLLRFRDICSKLGFPMCRKRSKGSRLSAWEARKHCACAQIQAQKVCRFFFRPGWVFGVLFGRLLGTLWAPFGAPWDPFGAPWASFGTPWDHFGTLFGHLGVTLAPFWRHGVLLGASGGNFSRI